MNYTYARDGFVRTKVQRDGKWWMISGPARIMRNKRSMLGAGTVFKQRRYRAPPRGEVMNPHAARRLQRIMQSKAVTPTPLFTTALQRLAKRSWVRGITTSITKYSAALLFSKAMRIRAGKR